MVGSPRSFALPVLSKPPSPPAVVEILYRGAGAADWYFTEAPSAVTGQAIGLEINGGGSWEHPVLSALQPDGAVRCTYNTDPEPTTEARVLAQPSNVTWASGLPLTVPWSGGVAEP